MSKNQGVEGSHIPVSQSYSKLKTNGVYFGRILGIILGIVGLVVAIIGFVGYLHVGALSNVDQVNAIIMMAVGGGCGLTLLIIVSIVKNRQTDLSSKEDNNPKGSISSEPDKGIDQTPLRDLSACQPVSTERAAIIRSINTQNGLVYGPEAWKIWGVEILDKVPPMPIVDLSKKDKILLYIPQRIRFKGKEQDLCLNVVEEFSGVEFAYIDLGVQRQFGNKPSSGGWILADKALIGGSREKNYKAHQELVEARNFTMPSILEAVVLHFMVLAFTNKPLYGERSLSGHRPLMYYTHCIEKFNLDYPDTQYPVIVGGSNPSCGLCVRTTTEESEESYYGVTCIQRIVSSPNT